MSARIIASGCVSAATFVAALSVPVAFPRAPQWIGLMGLAITALFAFLAILFWWLDHREKGQPTDVKKLAIPPDKPISQPNSKPFGGALEALLQDMELASRIAWANHRPPIETSYPRVLAESKAIIRELDDRLRYVNDALDGRKALRDWRGKIARQRVAYEALDKDPLAALTDKEREQVRIAVRDLADLDRHVSETIAEPRRFTAERVARMYKHRADKARNTLHGLIAIMEKEDED